MRSVGGWRAMAAALMAALCPPGPALAQSASLPVVREARVEARPSGVALILEASEPLTARTFALTDPTPRLVIDLPAVRWSMGGRLAEAGAAGGNGPVQGLRFARRDQNASRLVLDMLAPGARLAPPHREPTDNGGERLTFAVLGAGGGEAEAKSAPASTASPPPSPRSLVRREPRVVVVDAGHGGKDPGASGASGLREKDVTLSAAKKLRANLERRGYRVVLTRDEDVFLPLWDRVRVARAARADLFISLHADAHADPAARGASVYTLSEGGGARAKLMAGKQDWDLDIAEPPKSAAVNDILLDLAQRDSKNRSALFARTLVAHLAPVTPLLRNTHRNAGFFVLLAPDVPAVLVEMGFLTNVEDEQRLGDAQVRADVTDAIGEAVDAYFAEPLTFAGG